MKPQRILVLVHEDLVPPDSLEGHSESEILEWRTEYDVVSTLRKLGHEVMVLGVRDDLGPIRRALAEFVPAITFNLLEEFHGNSLYDHHVASYLELMQQPYTGCNPRGLMLAHDKALSKKILSFHRIRTPRFAVLPHGFQARALRRLRYPLFVKSQVEEGSFGIAQASIVRSEDKLRERVQFLRERLDTPVLVEEYIEGREIYLPLMGNQRLTVLPVIELVFGAMPEGAARIATRRVKWNTRYQEENQILIGMAQDLDGTLVRQIERLGKRIYRALSLTGYARIDFRLTPDNELYVLEANANPDISAEGEFATAAAAAGLPYPELLSRMLRLGMQYHRTGMPQGL